MSDKIKNKHAARVSNGGVLFEGQLLCFVLFYYAFGNDLYLFSIVKTPSEAALGGTV